MDQEKKHRRVLRGLFTKKANELDTLLSPERERDVMQINVCMQMLQNKFEELQVVDGKIYKRILTELQGEEQKCTETKKEPMVQAETASSADSVTGKRKFKLPTIELKKFNDNLKDWLPFWAQFKKVHEDDEIDLNDKIAYLSQATVPGSRARKIVDSYPPVPENYAKIVDSLKSRFGREDLQIEVYVRELLKLVLDKSGSKCGSVAVLYDEIESQLRSLETLGISSNKYAAMLSSGRFSDKGDVDTVSISEEHPIDSLDARLRGLMTFLRNEVENEQRLTLAVEGFNIREVKNDTESSNKRTKTKVVHSEATVATAAGLVNCDVARCIFCGGTHTSETCFKARNMTLAQKRELLQRGKACYRCLRVGHSAKRCHSKQKCILCGKSHAILMCLELPAHKEERDKEGKQVEQSDQVLTNHTSTRVFLQTLRVHLIGRRSTRQVRALLDTGSQLSYILQNTAQEMEFVRTKEEKIIHTLFGGRMTNEQRHTCYEVSVSGAGHTCSLEALDQPMICNPVPYIQEGPWTDELKTLGIAPTDVIGDGPIEMLFGADIIGKLYTGRKQELTCGLFAVETLLGWTLMGKIQSTTSSKSSAMAVFSLFVREAKVTDLWELDILGITDPAEKKSRKEKDKLTQDRFLATTEVDEQGRYVVRLPWLEDHPPLASNFAIAKKRLDSTANKLKSSQMFERYDLVFKEWESEDIIEEVIDSQSHDNGLVHYLPHRPVIKESSLTTKIRPVFDASSHEKGKPSLNQCLEVGPNLITRIPTVLLQFRLRKLGVVADIKKAFLQIAIHKEDRDYLRFLWLTDEGQIKIFRHKRVVFGVSSSPFLLGATIDLHLEKCKKNWTEGKSYSLATIDQLANSFYVDNCLASVRDQESLLRFIDESDCLMDEARMELRGWEFCGVDLPVCRPVPVLGLVWEKGEDVISIKEESLDVLQNIAGVPVTKRLILSVTQRIFDPIGLSCPVTLLPKLLLQQLWKCKQGWDTPLDNETIRKFKIWAADSQELVKIKIPRWIRAGEGEADSLRLHCFSDASKNAYAAVIFLRVECAEGIFVYLIGAKARVAPLKELTMPRLESLGATIAARLYDSVKKHFREVPAYFWSDSSTVVSWIKRTEEWSSFVINRVKEIRNLTEVEKWNHVPGTMNPADLPSRGCQACHLLQSRWWEGPPWLYQHPSDWPAKNCETDEDQINSEKRKTAVTLFNSDSNFCHLNHFSSYNKTIRMIAWIKRFCFNARNPQDALRGTLTVDELRAAEIFALITVQKESFKKEDPRLVSQRPDTTDFRFPIVLPGEHTLVRVLAMSVHKESCHVGTQGLLNILRERYWILGGRRVLRTVLSKCGICKRHSSKPLMVEPPSLPLDRVRDAAAFEVTGVDFAGPFLQEFVALTPAMFLRDHGDGDLPEADIIESTSLCRKARHRQKLLEDLRRRFRVEYLAQLKPHVRTNPNGFSNSTVVTLLLL
ncbi:hypothetical protein NQ317_015624 [Molorchus minor]|uniref:CCHC-type domain-containing protein n=1 Tax=Molorchus minor TaxID=1323400 RepID=A0ABQ9JUM0_9CUCU|nr:hypothetical protein NQ317_015624 [Molorchus minor]